MIENDSGQGLELLTLKRRQVALRRERISLIKRFGLAYYHPHEGQAAFHAAGLKFKRRLARTGNRWGKSIAGCAEDVSWLLNERPWYPEDSPYRRGGLPQHPVKLLTITTDWDKVDEIFTSQRGEKGKAWKFLPGDAVKPHGIRRNHSGAIDTIELKNGSLWRFDTVKSFMANPQGSESSDWDAIHVDEPCPEAMWKAVSRGLVDRGGSAWFTLTPLKEFWINDYFFPDGGDRGNVWTVTGSSYDNPYLSKEALEEFESTLTPEERECRIRGIPLHLSGLIYKDFKWDIHVLKDIPKGWGLFNEPPLNWPVYVYYDVHPQTPHALLFATVSPQGRHIYFADHFEHCSIKELAARVKSILGGRRIVWNKMDPLGFINDPITETNMAVELTEELARLGVITCCVEKATKALAQGILRVQGNFRYRSLVDSQPSIYFCPTCKRTLWEVQRYCWDDKENKPIDKDDHMMENLYRAELSDMRWIDMTPRPTVGIGMEDITRPTLSLSDLNYLGEDLKEEPV
jgi:hypothetical protein